MATSPNYGWSEPDNTSLVKDGAQAMRTLGDAIDTSVWNVGFGQAGKNKIINGDFSIWQRGTTFTLTSADLYTADRWYAKRSGANLTVSQQTFTPGTAPVAGYEGQYFMRVAATTADNNWGVDQGIENVRTFAGQTITISFWAKADATRTLNVYTSQDFNSPGGGSAAVTSEVDTKTLTTSWQRFTSTVALASVAGKTIAVNNQLNILFRHPVNSTGQFDIWGVQVEAGSKATPFQTASGGSIQGELAMCQRYYYRHTQSVSYERFAFGQAANTNAVSAIYPLKVTMRTNPTSIDYSSLTAYDQITQSSAATTVTMIIASTQQPEISISGVGNGLTQYRAYEITAAGTSGSYIGFSAEL